jgi:hypothetical protein
MDERSSNHRDEVVCRYGTPEGARAAMLRLEKLGFDGDAVTLRLGGEQVVSPSGARQADEEILGDVATAAGASATVGAVAGAAVGVVAGLATGDMSVGATVGSIAAVGGGVVGGLMGTYHDLPANPDALRTHEIDPDQVDAIEVAVRVESDEEEERAKEALLSR